MYTGPILPPAATSAPDTYLAESSLYSWSVPVQLDCPCIAGVSLYSWIVLIQLSHTYLRHRTATVY
jgi:hypothetical protein